VSDGPVSTVHRYPALYCQVAAAGLNLSVSTRNRYLLIAVCLANAVLSLPGQSTLVAALPSLEGNSGCLLVALGPSLQQVVHLRHLQWHNAPRSLDQWTNDMDEIVSVYAVLRATVFLFGRGWK
jgi:hypothetical protein